VIPAGLAVATFAGAAAASSANLGWYGCGSGVGSGVPCPPPSSPPPSPPPSPYLSVPDRLYGVAGTSADDVWAVGLEPSSSLIMHWDGSSWATSFTEPVGFFRAVSAVTASDAWAVGGTGWFDESHTLAEHWDGSSWTQASTPTPGSGVFNGVAATSAEDVWAVGLIGPGPGNSAHSTEPLIEHWNGSAWSEQTFADPSDGGQFWAAAATSADDAWAVGWTGDSAEGGGQTTMIYHWNGSSWTRVSSPDAAGSVNVLYGVTAISADDAWAVGFTKTADGDEKTLTMHWDGSTWTIVPSPSPGGDAGLQGVSAASASDIWAVGVANPTSCSHCETLAMHWDGSTWTVVPTPNPSSTYLNILLGVAVINGDGSDVWAVGTTDYASTLITHWDGSSWR